MSSSTLIVIPTFNDAANIAPLVGAIRAALPQAHVLIVDDASPDGTAAIARGLGETHQGVYLLERPAKLGLGGAYVAGFGWGLARGYRCFFEMDADFSHDPRAGGLVDTCCRAVGHCTRAPCSGFMCAT